MVSVSPLLFADLSFIHKKKSLLFGNSYACFKLDLPTDTTRTSPNSNRRLAVSSHSRPFTVKDKLGVTLKQTDEEQGEVVAEVGDIFPDA